MSITLLVTLFIITYISLSSVPSSTLSLFVRYTSMCILSSFFVLSYEGWSMSFWPGVARCNLTFPLESLSFFSITVLRMFWCVTIICVRFSVPIETPPKHCFWTFQQYLLATKIVDHALGAKSNFRMEIIDQPWYIYTFSPLRNLPVERSGSWSNWRLVVWAFGFRFALDYFHLINLIILQLTWVTKLLQAAHLSICWGGVKWDVF